jgi:hypothetical protein
MSAYDNFQVPFSLASRAPPARLDDPLSSICRALNQPVTPLLAAFFVPTNLDAVQNALRATIQRESGYVIGRQSDDALTQVMLRVFAEHAQHGAPDTRAEVARLNALVLGRAANEVAANMVGYLGYLRDASQIAAPLPRGVPTSIKGTTPTDELFRPM